MYPLNYIPPLKKLNLKPLVSDPTLQIGQHKCPLLSTWPRNNAPKVVGGGDTGWQFGCLQCCWRRYQQVLNGMGHPVPGQPDHWVNLLLCVAESHRLIIGFN